MSNHVKIIVNFEEKYMANLNVEFKGKGIIKTWSKQYSFVCFTVPRESVSTAIPDIETKMGVYFLVNSYEGRKDQNGNFIKRAIYIGKTSNGMSRFFNHKATKDWWDKIFFFTASKQYFDEDTILGLENLLITKYRQSGLYSMSQEDSDKEIDEDCELFGDQIIGIMDYFGYPLEEQELIEQDDKLPSKNEAIQQARITSDLLSEFDEAIKKLSPTHVKADQMKLYTSYKFENKNLCAAWVKNYGLELELYINIHDIKTINSGAYDITFRRRGKKESGMRVKSINDINKAISVIMEIIDKL